MPRTLLNPFMYSNNWEDLLLTTPGETIVKLPKGYYHAVIRGSGGCGGQNGEANAYAGGDGGAGGPGKITELFFLNTVSKYEATLYVGEQGKTYDNGGNGGARGTNSGSGANGGTGGGGAEPSYLIYSDNDVAFADGGAGGGGGGGGSETGRNSDGATGGAGGGRKYFDVNTRTIISVAGKQGGYAVNNGAGGPGYAGDTTNFPQVYSGAGGASTSAGGASASGGGASGGGGGSRGNHSGGESGSGGGGAAGDDIAGGGGRGQSASHFGGTAYNHYVTAIDTTAENALYGITGNYGTGGNGGNNEGTTGFILLEKIGRYIVPEVLDMGTIDAIPDETIDCGSIDSAVSDMIECGPIM